MTCVVCGKLSVPNPSSRRLTSASVLTHIAGAPMEFCHEHWGLTLDEACRLIARREQVQVCTTCGQAASRLLDYVLEDKDYPICAPCLYGKSREETIALIRSRESDTLDEFSQARDEPDRIELGRKGMELAEGLNGYAVFTGCEGDDPQFLGFFFDEAEAERLLKMKDPDDSEVSFYCDPYVVPAILTPYGIVAAVSYEIETHDQLRERFNSV